MKYTYDDLKERLNIEYKAYQEALEKLTIQEKKESEIPQYKKDMEKMNSLEKKKKESILNLERLKSELQSIKQTLDEYEDKKKKLKEKCNMIQKENEKLKELNAILQCLIHVTPLVDYFKDKFDKIEDIGADKSFHKKKLCLTDSLKELIDKVWPKDVKGKRDGNLQEISKVEESKELLGMIYK